MFTVDIRKTFHQQGGINTNIVFCGTRCCLTEPLACVNFWSRLLFPALAAVRWYPAFVPKESRSRVLPLRTSCVYSGALLFIYFFGCCWCWCWEGLQSKKKATHSHTNANRRQQSKDSQSGLFFRRRLCISEQREQRAAWAPLSRGCLPVASSPCAKLPHFPAAVCWSWDCVMVWISEPLKNTHTHTHWHSEPAHTLFDQREHVVSLPSPVAWNHFPQE